ncbi:hypothetical protein A2U01_0078479 [Trifolium medium]|uniref:Uncharacterized protein n=1 Tax=Trifolium medium TaxID=97028 RepID=A0A392T854_9FABA|nr:hypothetical protein [Trifolium medium]
MCIPLIHVKGASGVHDPTLLQFPACQH